MPKPGIVLSSRMVSVTPGLLSRARHGVSNMVGMVGSFLLFRSPSGQGRLDATRHAVSGVSNGLVGKIGVALRGLDQGVTEQLGDGHHVHAAHGGNRRPVVTKVVKPQAGQACLASDAVPLVLEDVDVSRRRTHRKQERAIGAIVGNDVGDRARGARQRSRARPGLRIGKVDALATNPVPFEGDGFSDAASGEHQQADDGDGLGTIELVSGEHGVEPGHLLGGQEPLLGPYPVSLGVLSFRGWSCGGGNPKVLPCAL